jgi:hypothetical protein
MDREDLTAFLSNTASYAPQSVAITGILKQMGDTMSASLADATGSEEASVEASLADATAAEEKAIVIFDALIAAKDKQINADTAAIESKIERIGNLGVEIETMKGDLSDTAQSMIEDKKFLADFDKTCKTNQAEWDERCKVRNDELLALLADTIKMLNDNDALELFKKTLTLPGAAVLLQTEVISTEVRLGQDSMVFNWISSRWQFMARR